MVCLTYMLRIVSYDQVHGASERRTARLNRRTRSGFSRLAVCTAMGLILGLTYCGCNGDILNAGKMLPAPLRYDFPYSIDEANRIRWWDGDNFDVKVGDVVHYIVVRGLIPPRTGQPFATQSRDRVRSLSRRKNLDIVVYRHDESKREVGDVFLDGENLGLRIIREGLAWYDGNEFEGSEQYRLAEEEAREKKLGLWASPDPVHPAEFLDEQARGRGLTE